LEEVIMASLYDRADLYDMLEGANGYAKYRNHWKAILQGRKIESFLDVSIGTGNVTLPLADLGVTLAGSDLSPVMLDKCRKKADIREIQMELQCCDFRTVADHFQEKFDCVASTGDSLPHVSKEDVLKTLEQMDSLVKPGGYLYFDVRNWDKVFKDRKRFYSYNPFSYGDITIHLIQFWDCREDDEMTYHLLCTYEKENSTFNSEHFEEHYVRISQSMLLDKIKEMGYKNIEIMNFPSCGPNRDVKDAEWYCVIAEKSARPF
jgi:SAM-dependent methyltransferase